MKLIEILSIYAACLSTIVFAWNIIRTIPRYKVEICFGLTNDNDKHQHGIYITTKNPSPHTVHLAYIDILYRYGETRLIDKLWDSLKYRRLPMSAGWVYSSLSNYEINDQCPMSLESGKSHMVFIPNDILEEIMKESDYREIKACVSDQLYRRKYSEVFNYPKEGVVKN